MDDFEKGWIVGFLYALCIAGMIGTYAWMAHEVAASQEQTEGR